MFLSVLRYLSGTVEFQAEGIDIEKFYTFCSKNNIDIISPQKNGYRLYAETNAKNYKKMRCPAKKFGIKLKLLNKKGLYFLLKRNRFKIGMALGTAFIMLFCVFMNFFVWEINVIGNQKTKTEDIIRCAEEMGLFTGTLAKSHFVQDMEWYILRENPNLASVEINIQGSIANILINERETEPEMISDDDIPTNLVASRYGVVRKINVYDGQRVVDIGEAVMKGDLLVSAVYEDRHNKLTLKHARAEVFAETDYSIEVEYPLEEVVKRKDRIKGKTYEISILGYTFTIGNAQKYKNLPNEIFERELVFFWIELPIKLKITSFFAVKDNAVTHNFDQGRAGAFEILEQKENKELANSKIISRKTDEKIKDGKYIINAEYIVLMDIVKEQPIESDIPWENTDDMS